MSHFITIPAVVLVLVACVAAAPAQDKPTWWRISLKEDPAIAVGKSAIVAGAIGPKGAHLYVKGLEDSALMQITVVTHDPAVRLNVGVTKSDLKIYLKEGETGDDGVCTLRLRTSENAWFKISGPKDAKYTTIVWAGPKIELPPPMPGSSMKSHGKGSSSEPSTERSGKEVKAASIGRENSNPGSSDRDPGRETDTAGDLGVFAAKLLMAVLAVGGLVVFVRRQRGAALGLLVLAFTIPVAAQTAKADPYAPKPAGSLRELLEEYERSRDPSNKPFEPWKKKEPTSRDVLDATNKAAQELRDLTAKLEPLVRAANGKAADQLKLIGVGLDLLEQFGWLDPRESAIKPDYAPEGLPPIPSRSQDENRCNDKCGWCYREAQKHVQRGRVFLEKNYVVHRQTMMEVDRLKRLIDAAESVHGLVKLMSQSMSLHPSFSANASEKAYFKKYRGAQGNGLTYLKNGLILMAESERRHWAANEWFARYGLDYYLFHRDRYTGKPK